MKFFVVVLLFIASSLHAAPVASDVVDARKKVIPEAYRAMAAQLSKEAGIAYRYGPDAASYGVTDAGLPTWYRRPDNKVEMPYSVPVFWQVGGPLKTSQGYSTNQGQPLFVPDDPTQRAGISTLEVSAYDHNTFRQGVNLSWTLYGAGLDDVNVVEYRKAGLTGGTTPVASGRCSGRAGWCTTTLVALQNGLLATVGTNTSRNRTTLKLAADKVPTAVAMTNNSEFALVTVWDTTALKGQVAVIALAGHCDNEGKDRCINPDGTAWYRYWEEWSRSYPGLANRGNIGYMKLLGYVDLPGMAAPTEIHATSGVDQWSTMIFEGPNGSVQTGPWGNPLTQEDKRQKFKPGGPLSGKYAKGGTAVVISKSEQKAVFIDLGPLFRYVNAVYFGGSAAEFKAKVIDNFDLARNVHSKWPHSFEYAPQQTPVVVKTVDLGARPTAVKTAVWGPGRAWIATQEGTLRMFSLGANYAGSGATAADIRQTGTVAVGRNPTGMSFAKDDPDRPDENALLNQVVVVSRGDRKIDWIRFNANQTSGSVIRTLKDTRIKDPIAIDEGDNFGTAGYIISVADYAGRTLSNYRFGPVTFSDQGKQWNCQPPGCPTIDAAGNPAPFEFGGAFALPGKVFGIQGQNVP